MHLGTSNYGETVIIFTPSVYAKDTKYFIRSLSFDRIENYLFDLQVKGFVDGKLKMLSDDFYFNLNNDFSNLYSKAIRHNPVILIQVQR